MGSGVVEGFTDRGGPQAGDQLELLGEAGESLAQRWKRDRVGQVFVLEPAGADSVPSRIDDVSRAMPPNVNQESVGPGPPSPLIAR